MKYILPLLGAAAAALYFLSHRTSTHSGTLKGPIAPEPSKSPYPVGSIVTVDVGDVSLEDLTRAAGGIANASLITEIAIRPDQVTPTMITGPWVALLKNSRYVKPDAFVSSTVARNAVIAVYPFDAIGV